jgi:hypothetical protein
MFDMNNKNFRSYHWLAFPGAVARIRREPGRNEGKEIIVISGNNAGLVSLGNVLLAISQSAADTESLSITGLPFVRVQGALSLMVVQADMGEEPGKIVRTDKHDQYQWLLSDERLEREAMGILKVAYTEDGYTPDHHHAYLSGQSEAELLVERDNET